MTKVFTMPPILNDSISSEEEVAFKVLNQDNLPITIRGEAILKPFGFNTNKDKPNLIVHPTRRFVSNLEEHKERVFSKSNGYIPETNTKIKKSFSNSHGNLNHTNSATKFKLEDFNNQLDSKFTRTLDNKLRKLQKEEKQSKISSSKKQQVDCIKKPFVTTVKKGEFLEPPPEIASLLGLRLEEPLYKKDTNEDRKILYAYFSQPRVLNRVSNKNLHVSRCDAAGKAAGKVEEKNAEEAAEKSAEKTTASVVGVRREDEETMNVLSRSTRSVYDAPLPYANLMFEKRVFRGSNFAPTTCEHMGDGESAAARAAEARRRATARRKAKNQQIRAAQLRLGSPPPVHGRKHEQVQTELYLEELMVNPPVLNMCTQTDLFLERPVSPLYVPIKTGIDEETQIYPGDLFDFDMEVQPILEVLVGKTIEQSLIEVLEEEELAALREQQRKFLELRSAETAEAQRIEEREKRLIREKERRLRDYEEGLAIQKEMEERIAASVLMQGYLSDLLPSVLEGLKSEGFLMDSIQQDVDEGFMPWLMKEVTAEMQEMVSSRDILTDIVREILENRAEIYKAMNTESPEEEEEGPTQEDILLTEHLKLKEQIAKAEEQEQENQKEQEIPTN